MRDHHRYMPYPELVEKKIRDRPYHILDSGSLPAGRAVWTWIF